MKEECGFKELDNESEEIAVLAESYLNRKYMKMRCVEETRVGQISKNPATRHLIYLCRPKATIGDIATFGDITCKKSVVRVAVSPNAQP